MNIPIVDFQAKDAAARFIKSIRTTGFGVLTNTDVAQIDTKNTYFEFEKFFQQSEEQKRLALFDKETQAGYFPMLSEKAKDSNVKDLKEFFHYYPNRPGADTAVAYPLCVSLEFLAYQILDWLQEAYPEKTTGSWAGMVELSQNTLFRVIHYPPLSGNEEPGAVRASAHEDINFITFLPAATAPGLQVKDKIGNWHDVGTDPNSIIVNVGDMLQLLTKGYYPSTTHRVINPTGENVARYSMPLFVHPHPDTQLAPDKTANQYLMERLKELGLI